MVADLATEEFDVDDKALCSKVYAVGNSWTAMGVAPPGVQDDKPSRTGVLRGLGFRTGLFVVELFFCFVRFICKQQSG